MQLKILKFLFILLILSPFYLLSQSQQETVYQIAGISVDGNNFVQDETIIALSGIEVGSELKIPFDEELTNAIKKLWGRKQFSSVDIKIDKITTFGVFLLIEVEENSRLDEIIIKNNKEIDEDDIKEAIDKTTGDILSGYDVYLIKKDVKKFYNEEGLQFAKVQSDIYDSDREKFVNLELYIDEGNEFYVNSIEFEGNSDFSDSDLASAFDDTKTTSWYEFWASSKFNKEEYTKDIELLKKFFKKEGYIDGEVISDSVIYNEESETIDIKIKVHEGKKLYIRNIEFQGNTVFPDRMLVERLEMEKGETYDLEKFEQNLRMNEAQTDASSLYNNTGYLFAEFRKTETRIPEDSVDILIKVFENERVKVRKVNIIGNFKTKDKVIRRELYVRPGDYFNRKALIESVKALGVLNYFNPEALRPDVKPVPTDKTQVDIEFSVEERSTDTFNASIGFAGSFGLTGMLGFTFNNFSLTEPLRGGGGEVFNFNWEFGQFSRYQNFHIGYTQPWLMDVPTTVGFNLFRRKLNYSSSYRYTTTGASINGGRRFKWPDNYFRGNWSLRYQLNDVAEGTSSAYYRPGISNEVTIGQSISRISLNNMFFPTVGSNFNLKTNFALGALGIGNTDYLKNELNFDMYSPLLTVAEQDRVVLYTGVKMGYITSLSDDPDNVISPIELYRMGGNGLGGLGVTPLRGYEDNSVNNIGGQLVAKYTAELRLAISMNPMPLFVYGFAEAGNVWNEFGEVDPFKLKRSAGVGLQILMMPLGVIGFSYGYGFDSPSSEFGLEPSGWKFLFHLGNNQ